MEDPSASRRELMILERLAADRARDGLLSLAAYRALFPNEPELLERCLAEFVREERASEGAGNIEHIGPYRLERRLGHGGQGAVFLAKDERIGRSVALKLLPRAFLERGSPSAALARELEALRRIEHTGVAGILDVGEHEGRAYLVTRYVEGRSLEALLASWQRGEAPPLAARVALAAALAEALAAAHRAGVVHRDVKPGNVIVTVDDAPVLIDFGLARAVDSELPSWTRTGDLLGTPRYLAPERLRGEGRDDPRGDVWALGVVLCELATLTAPFDGPSLEALGRAIERDEPPRLAKDLAGSGESSRLRDLDAIVSKALSKRASDRYAEAGALASDLRAWTIGGAISVRPLTSLDRAQRWISRNPLVSAFVLLLLVALGTTTVLALRLDDRANAERRARLEAQLLLARSESEGGRLLLEGPRLGRREAALQRFAAASTALRSTRVAAPLDEGAAGFDELELRSAAARALLAWDLVPCGEIECGGFGSCFATPAGDALLYYGVVGGERRAELRAFETARGTALELPAELLAPRSTPLAVGPQMQQVLFLDPAQRLQIVDLRGEPAQRISELGADPRATRADPRERRTRTSRASASFSPDGRRCVFQRGEDHGGSWWLFDVASRQALQSGRWSGDVAWSASFAANGAELLVPGADARELLFLAAADGAELRREAPLGEDDSLLLAALPIENGETMLAVRRGAAVELRWSGASAAERRVRRLRTRSEVSSARFARHAEGRWIALAAGELVALYDRVQERVVVEGEGPAGVGVDLACFTPEGELLLYRRGGRIARHRVAQGLPFRERCATAPEWADPPPWLARKVLPESAAPAEEQLSPARFVVVDGDLPLRYRARGAPFSIEGQARSENGKRGAARISLLDDGRLRCLLIASAGDLRETILEEPLDAPGRGGALALSSDGRELVEITSRGELALYELDPPRCVLRLALEELAPRALRFEGAMLLAWHAEGGAERLHLARLREALLPLFLAW